MVLLRMKKLILGFLLLFNFGGILMAQGRNLKPFKPEKNMLALNDLQETVTIKVGQKAYIQHSSHVSVGIGAELEIGDESKIKISKEHIKYEKAHRRGMTGDDAATVTLVLEALETGTTQIVLKNMFRRKIESEYTILITIVK
jgi:predicted secreted protein